MSHSYKQIILSKIFRLELIVSIVKMTRLGFAVKSLDEACLEDYLYHD